MIDYLKHMAVFSRVAETGSFSQAARSLGIAPSRVSEAITKLEDFLGTSLLNRTTRQVALTSEGRRLYAHTSSILKTAEQGLNELNNSKSEPIGSLQISVPAYLSSSSLAQAIGAFVEMHSQVDISISFTDLEVNPIKDNFDMCIRSGRFDFPNSTVCKLGEIERMVVVGARYYSKRTAPQHPTELSDWSWINYRHKERNLTFSSTKGEKAHLTICEQARLRVDNIDALYFFANINLGVALVPVSVDHQGVEEGQLVRLLDDWYLPPVQYYAVWPEKSNRESLISTLVTYLKTYLKSDTN